MSEDTDRQARLTQVAGIAVALEKKTLCPAPLMIAQWAVESRWGSNPVGHANYFGNKKNSRDPESCTEPTTEVIDGKPVEEELQFADYDSLEDSCRDYAGLITTGEPYRTAWEQYSVDRNLNALIVAVAAKYATDPGYGALVSLIANQTNVQRAIVAARREALGV
jgi:flagellum-specific peptidoglycan hydrolase FlgJ